MALGLGVITQLRREAAAPRHVRTPTGPVYFRQRTGNGKGWVRAGQMHGTGKRVGNPQCRVTGSWNRLPAECRRVRVCPNSHRGAEKGHGGREEAQGFQRGLRPRGRTSHIPDSHQGPGDGSGEARGGERGCDAEGGDHGQYHAAVDGAEGVLDCNAAAGEEHRNARQGGLLEAQRVQHTCAHHGGHRCHSDARLGNVDALSSL